MSQFPIEVKKVWGSETWLVNEPEFCAKLLEIRKGASGSLHYHRIKKEVFIFWKGEVDMEIGSQRLLLNSKGEPLVVLPGIPHRMTGLEDSMILEVSTHHDDIDVVRIEESKA